MWATHVRTEPIPKPGTGQTPLVAAAAVAAPSAPTAVAPAVLSGHVVTSSAGDEYELARQNYNARLDFHPAEVVYCYGETDVVNAVRYGIANGRQVCMRSGAHDYEGFSNNDGGLVIDTSRLNFVRIAADARTAVVGPGTPLRTLYHLLGDRGFTLPGGSCGTVGVAGLVTGGGFGLISRKYGMFCDKLVRVRMVDGTGAPQEATRGNDPDGLLWATCGGGGGNFGVVTEFEFELVPVTGLVTTFSYGWPSSDDTTRELVARFTRWQPSNDMFATLLFRAGGASIYVSGQSFSSEADTRAELAAILDGDPLPPPRNGSVSPLQTMSVLDAAESDGGDDAAHESYKNTSSLGRGELNAAGIDALVQRLHAGVPSLGFVQFDTFGGAINDVDKNATAFVHRDMTYTVQYQTYWTDPADAPGSETWLRDTFEAIDPHIGTNASYRNYCDLNLTDWEARYYGENAAQLRLVKTRFDPNNLFNYPQSISPA